MGIQIFGTAKCFDTKKAQRFFKERRIPVQNIDLTQKGFSPRELESVRACVGLDALIDPKSKAYDRSAIAYLAYEEDKLAKLLECPALLRTPIVRSGRKATVGYAPEVWEQWLAEEKG